MTHVHAARARAHPGMLELNLARVLLVLLRGGFFEKVTRLPSFRSRARAAARGGRAPATPSWFKLGCPNAVV